MRPGKSEVREEERRSVSADRLDEGVAAHSSWRSKSQPNDRGVGRSVFLDPTTTGSKSHAILVYPTLCRWSQPMLTPH
jgi:hypothetical protein